MKFLKCALLAVIVCSCNYNTSAQSKIKSYTFKKGEVLDILLLSQKPKADSLFKNYVKTAFPLAIKMSYKGLPGFKVENYTQGNLQPQSLILGKWNSKEKREKFITDIENVVPDFQQQRRDIWSLFNLTYYEMPEITFEINKDKYNVVTAYWQKEGKSFTQFKKKWLQKSSNKGGKTILELTNGKSPLGYYYQPDYFVITQWENKTDFEAFHKENLIMNHEGVLHMNQFVIN